MSKADDPQFRIERARKGGAATARYWDDVKIAAAVDKVVANAPALTPDQISKLRAVLRVEAQAS